MRTRGIVVRDFPLSEQDKIVYLLTRDHGIVKVVAKGALKIKSRFAQLVQFPCCVDALVYRKNGADLGTLNDAVLRHGFVRIRSGITRFAFASCMAELVLSGLDVGEQNEAVYYLLLQHLLAFEGEDPRYFESMLSAFKLKFLRRIGYAPELTRCIECGRDRQVFHSFYFSPKGGIVCENCQRKENQVMGISLVTVLAMEQLARKRPRDVASLNVQRVERQIVELLDAYIAYHLGRRVIAGRQLIDTLQAQGVRDGKV
jgi:DNA repair protein RecO (recombination protein O)